MPPFRAARAPPPMADPDIPAAGRIMAAAAQARPAHAPASPEQELIRVSGLFDAAWYLETYPDVAAATIDPLTHFAAWGWHEGRRPNLYFDTAWYLRHNPEIARAGINPLVHYIRLGEAENRSPCAHFDVPFYRTRHAAVASSSGTSMVIGGSHSGCG